MSSTPKFKTIEETNIESLPPDIIYLILELLWTEEYGGQAAVKAFSVISRAVRQKSMAALFESISWGSRLEAVPKTLWPYVRKFTFSLAADVDAQKDAFTEMILGDLTNAPRLRHFCCASEHETTPEPWPELAVALTVIQRLDTLEFRVFRWSLDDPSDESWPIPSRLRRLRYLRSPGAVWCGLPRDAEYDLREARSLHRLAMANRLSLEELTLPGEMCLYGQLGSVSWPELIQLTIVGAPPAYPYDPLIHLLASQGASNLPALRKLKIRLIRPPKERFLLSPPGLLATSAPSPDVVVSPVAHRPAGSVDRSVKTEDRGSPAHVESVPLAGRQGDAGSNENVDDTTPDPTASSTVGESGSPSQALHSAATAATDDRSAPSHSSQSHTIDRREAPITSTPIAKTSLSEAQPGIGQISDLPSEERTSSQIPAGKGRLLAASLPRLRHLHITNPLPEDLFWDQVPDYLEKLVLFLHPNWPLHAIHYRSQVGDEYCRSFPSIRLRGILEKLSLPHLVTLWISFWESENDIPLFEAIAGSCPSLERLDVHRFTDVQRTPNYKYSMDDLRDLCRSLQQLRKLHDLRLNIVYPDTPRIRPVSGPYGDLVKFATLSQERAQLMSETLPSLRTIGLGGIGIFFELLWQKFKVVYDESGNRVTEYISDDLAED